MNRERRGSYNPHVRETHWPDGRRRGQCVRCGERSMRYHRCCYACWAAEAPQEAVDRYRARLVARYLVKFAERRREELAAKGAEEKGGGGRRKRRRFGL